ncbi:MAG: energy-coupling factor transporter ATPase [Clostridiales bacterium]|nr:energy-coupling factor transporter ATPase [Clostridiales bacterium]
MTETVIKTENLNFQYETDDKIKPVLFDINLDIKKGSFVCILGRNGSGKSTLAKVFCLVNKPTSGSLELFGTKIGSDVTEDQEYEIRKKIGMVFQNPDNQMVATIVEEDVAFGPENLGVEPKEIRRRVDEALDIVGMKEFARHSASQLSGGQKQRVAIAGIIALSPDVIVFDESTAMLDPIGRREVMQTILKLAGMGKTIILITHHMDEAVYADRIIVLSKGRVAADGTPEGIFSREKMLKETGLDLPQSKKVLNKLSEKGLDISTEGLDPKSAAEKIADALRKRGLQ